jgi:uncharacterized protein YecT (DUF1311 family)
MKGIIVSLVIVTCLVSTMALTQKKGARKSPCANIETQSGANACARYKYEQADVQMNKVYAQLMSELGGKDDKNQQKLKQAQQLWLQYRDANCESESSIYEGGSIRPAVYNHCLATTTEERTRRMKTFLAEIKM